MVMSDQVETRDILGSGAGGPLPAISPWSDWGSYIQYAKGVAVGPLAGMGNGSINAIEYYVNGTKFDFTTVVAVSGSTMTGPLVLPANPTTNLQAATKQYVDGQVAIAGNGRFLALTGGTLTGALVLAADPTLPLGSTTKQYVDGRTPITADAPNDGNYYTRYNQTWQLMPSGITIPDAPHDSNTYARLNSAWSNVFDAGAYPGAEPAVLRILRSNTNGSRPASKSYGEPYVNFVENQFGVIDNTGAARDLIGAPLFSTALSYAVGITVTYGGKFYVSIAAVTPGAFNPAQWATYITANSPALTGTPTAPTPATATNTTQIATTAYVKANLANYIPQGSATMTGNYSVTGNFTVQATLTVNGGTNLQGDVSIAGNLYVGNHLGAYGFIDLGSQSLSAGGGTNSQANMRCSNGQGAIGFTGAGDNGSYAEIYYNNYGGSFVGSIQITNSGVVYLSSSDVRLKKNEVPFVDGREILDNIPIKRFEWAHSGEQDIGVMAQEVHAAYPRAISPGVNKPGDKDFVPWQVDYSKYVPLLIQALQEAYLHIDGLTARIEALEGKIQ